jgi:outer membrane biogenesis lipoprotein LolB
MHPRTIRFFAILFLVGCSLSCRSVPPPANPYSHAPDLLTDMNALRSGVKSFRIAGTVDHLGRQRVQGKAFLFGELPGRLRVDVLSPFGTTLSVLTVDAGVFGLSDHREGRFFSGPAQPCNIARLIGIALPAEDIIRIVLGQTPLIETDGETDIQWHRDGFYRVTLRSGDLLQRLDIDPDRNTLRLRRSVLEDKGTVVYEIAYSRWRAVNSRTLPMEIRIRMPAEKSEIVLRHEPQSVDLNVPLPADAWRQTFPTGARIQEVSCD